MVALAASSHVNSMLLGLLAPGIDVDSHNCGHWPQITFLHLRRPTVLNTDFEHGDSGSRVSTEVPLVGVKVIEYLADAIF